MAFTRRTTALFCLLTVYTGFLLIHTSAVLRLVVILASACTLLLTGFRFFRTRSSNTFPIRLIAAALCIGSLLPFCYTDCYAAGKIRQLENRSMTITAVIRSQEYATAYAAGYTARLQEADGHTTRVRILLETSNVSLEAGDVVVASALLTQPDEYSGTFPQRRYYLSKNILLVALCDDVSVTDHTPAGIVGFFQSLRAKLIGRFRVLLGRSSAALPAALFLGDRSLLSDTLTRDFRRLGISHLLAISGLHFMLLFGIWERVLACIIRYKKPRLLLLCLSAVAYMFLCGMSASVLRAGVMLIFSYIAAMLNRHSDLPTTLGISSLFLVVIQPFLLYDVGFQLSVTAVLGILCFSHMQKILFRRMTRLTQALFLSLTVQMMMLPLLWFYFGEVSPLAPLTTLLFSPLIEGILLLTPLLLLFGQIPVLSDILCHLLIFLGNLTETGASVFSRIPFSSVSLRQPAIPILCILGTLLLVGSLSARKRKTVGILLTGCLCLYTSVFLTAYCYDLHIADQIRIIASVQGKNDALILRTERQTLLCDFSDGSYSALHHAMSVAQTDGATELDVLMLTHLHKRHIQSVARLCDACYVHMLLIPEPISETERAVYASLIRTAEENGTDYCTYTRNGTSAIHFASLTLSATATCISRSPHPVLSLSVSHNEHSLLYLGTSWQEPPLLAGQTGEASVLLFGAHGPIYKSAFDAEISAGLQYVLFYGEAYAYASDSFRERIQGISVPDDAQTVLILLPNE